MKKTNYIAQLQEAYYNGTPLVTDEEYDNLVKYIEEETIGPTGTVNHPYQMYSLKKVYPSRGDKYPDWWNSGLEIVTSKKLDGASLDCVYLCTSQGHYELAQLITRGDGVAGENVPLSRASCLNIPAYMDIDSYKPIITVIGEVVSTEKIDNARNICAGALNLKNDQEFFNRVELAKIRFFAYGLLPIDPSSTYKEDMFALGCNHFWTIFKGINGNFPTDGIVHRINSNSKFLELGYTAKFPRGAIAEKEDAEYVETILRDVEWNVGVTGKVTPTAIFDEVIIDGCKISRATLNNVAYIEALGLEIGSRIGVIRAGGIIPKIISIDSV
jgi:DNA ligase (NAD+)